MMKKLSVYLLLMLGVVILLPLLVVRGCDLSIKEGDQPQSEQKIEKSTVSIRVYNASEKKVEVMLLEEYIKGVVAAEMPADFSLEALKAQAVAARTYAYARKMGMYLPDDNPHPDADICTDSAHCQAWISKDAAMKKWGIFSAFRNWNRIVKAVEETRETIITYEGGIINPVFHSNSGGRTENAEDVWACNAVPYLQSVTSEGEEGNVSYKNQVVIKDEDFKAAVKKKYPSAKFSDKDLLKQIDIIDYTQGGRVNNIKIGNIIIKGTDFRALFSLKSANFTLKREDKNEVRVTTIGYGHGVGMSQWGANHLASNGGSFDEIIRYYYQGVELTTIDLYTQQVSGESGDKS